MEVHVYLLSALTSTSSKFQETREERDNETEEEMLMVLRSSEIINCLRILVCHRQPCGSVELVLKGLQ